MRASFKNISLISFDCYGTLIDWEAGILAALQPWIKAGGLERTDAELLGMYARIESECEQGVFRSYREVLQDVMLRMAGELGMSLREGEENLLAGSLGSWPPFSDTVEALKKLKSKYRLAVISNVDDDLFVGTQKLLQIEFDEVVTAAQVRSYKPSQNNFLKAKERFGIPVHEWLHAAQSLYHDIAPAKALGIPHVWVNRRAGKSGSSAVPDAEVKAVFEVPDLKTLAAWLT